MIEKIIKIKNLGLVFADYSWDATLPNFRQFNLIYGMNGSGKTTLSRLYNAIGGTSLENVEYVVADDTGTNHSQADAFPRKVRVFNHEYVRDNVKVVEGRANSISILLGKENKDLVEKIEVNKKLLSGDPEKPGKIPQRASKDEEGRRKSNERGSKFTDVATTIGVAMGGNALRNYKKTQSEKDFVKLEKKALLSEQDLEKYTLAAKAEPMASVDPLAIGNIKLTPEEDEILPSDALKTIGSQVDRVCKATVESEVISRLSKNKDISDWVERGMAIHTKHESNVCEYCSQELSQARARQLAKHFNEADAKLKTDADTLMANLEAINSAINWLPLPDEVRFYTGLRANFKSKAADFAKAKTKAVFGIKTVIDALKAKKSRTTEVVEPPVHADIETFLLSLGEINRIVSTHNATTTDFEKVKNEAAQKLKEHYLSTIYDDVNALGQDIKRLDEEVTALDSAIADIRAEIDSDMAKISSSHKACDIINEKLSAFLGHRELTFTPELRKEKDTGGNEKEVVAGYRIMRGKKPAEHLSEGEKTALAFVYFVVHLTDQNFTIGDGIVVIDDPISSLDSNSLYQAFSFLKDSVKDAKQVFVLTHNFDFLKLILNWRKGTPDKNSAYFMVKNKLVGNERAAYLCKMDRELLEYESEYHYLFKLLKQMLAEQDGSIAKAYPIPNIARKVFDTFLTFAVPNGKNQYSKVIELKNSGYDAQKLDAIYKFTNDQSHITGAGFNPALVPESKKVVDELFEMMEKIAPMHYKAIDQATL